MKSHKQLRILFLCFYLIFSSTLHIPAKAESTKKDIAVGVIIPLTGALAEYGVAMQNGIALAQKSNPDLFKNTRFIYEDSQYNPQSAITIFRKLAANKDVKLIINFGCPTSQALVPLVEKEKIPTAMLCSALLLTKDRKYSFGMTSPASESIWQ